MGPRRRDSWDAFILTILRVHSNLEFVIRARYDISPVQPGRFSMRVLAARVLFAPLGWLAIHVGFTGDHVFLLIDVEAEYLHDPFDGRAADTPTFTISRTIGRNLWQQRGERSLPPGPEPVDGVLIQGFRQEVL